MSTFVSLFAGVGGFDLGLEQSGHTCIGQVEIDKHAQKILKKHWPDVPLHDDVTTAIKWAKEMDLIGRVDIVCGGFPCQDVSVAGKRAGAGAGTRSGLFWNAIQFAQEVKAQTIVLENVPGLLSSNQGRDFGTVLTALADAGYRHIEWRVLDSQFFGVPQRRRRVFIIGSVTDRSTNPIFIERNSVCRNFKTSKKTKKNTSNNASTGFGQSSFGGYTEGVTTLTASSYKRPEDNIIIHFAPSSFAQYKEGFGTLKTNTGNENVVVAFDDYNLTVNENLNQTLRQGGDVPMIFNRTVRRLTPIECERLQGFPDDWTAGQANSHRYKQMGNAVTVNVARWIGFNL